MTSTWVASLAQQQSYDNTSASEVILTDIGPIRQHQTTYKTRQIANQVHIYQDVLQFKVVNDRDQPMEDFNIWLQYGF